jgi:Tfp pilus assembly protein FimT
MTLLEALVAVVVSALLLAAALPSLHRALAVHSLQASVRKTVNTVRVVRSTAVARNLPARLAVADDGTVLSTQVNVSGSWLSVGSPVRLDGGVVVSAIRPSSSLVFSPQGIANAPTTITLRARNGETRSVTVSLLGSVGAS